MTQEPNIFPYIARLLQGAEVVWKPLGEVVRLEKGKQLNKTALLEEGTYPAYNGGVSFSGFTNTYNYEENTIIISQGGASAGFVNFVTTKFYANAHCYVILPNTELVEAHRAQTKLLQDYASGIEMKMEIIMIHAQDHLMTTMTLREVAIEMLNLYRKVEQ